MQLRRGMMADFARGYEAGMRRIICPLFETGHFKAGYAKGKQERYLRIMRALDAERARGR